MKAFLNLKRAPVSRCTFSANYSFFTFKRNKNEITESSRIPVFARPAVKVCLPVAGLMSGE